MAVEVAVTDVSVEENLVVQPAAEMSPADRWRLFMFSGALILLINFGHPAGGIIDIPVSFFLKNKLHLQANQLAVFKLWAGMPLFLGFVFGFIRDRWSPFGTGDRGHLVIFGLVTALIYGLVALVKPTYAVLLGGLFVGTMAFQIVGGAAAGIVSAIGQRRAMSGRMSALISISTSAPSLIAFILGGLLSQVLESRDATTASRILFLVAGGMMAVIALFGVLGPRSVFAAAHAERTTSAFFHDIGRFFRHWPIYPVIVIQLLWQFAPGTGIVLQYHMSNTLHATDAQWGLWNALFLGSFLPIFIGYGFLCTRVKLGWLLWIGFGLAVTQMTPMLFVHTAVGAILGAVPMGIIGGLAQASLQDLTIRSCPPGLQGTMMMLFVALYYIAVRFGDLFGTFIYDHWGGFYTAIWATIGVYALILPALLLVPKQLIATADGEVLAA